jgi:acyl-CoA synthetase (AMP-forming)/AMP-acid ligase II
MTVRQIAGEFETVTDVLRAAAAVNGDVEAYVEPATDRSPRRSLTFAQWDRAADGVAGLFADHGVGPGTVVCLLLPSSIEYAVGYSAAARLGAVTSGINLRLGAAEARSILERTLPVVTVVENGADTPPGPAGTVLDLSAMQGAVDGPAPGAWPDLDRTDPVAVVWTSGTTGLPKGAVFDHANLAAVAEGTDVLSESGDRRLSPLPFAHIGSMTRPWDEIANGVTTVITPTPWRAGDAVGIMAEERITVAQGVPTQWALVLAHPEFDAAGLSTLRIAGTGASRVPPELVAELRARLGVPVVVRYTSTEASLGTGTVPGDPDEVVATTVGRPGPGVELAIADDTGRAVADDEVGRVRLRSAAVMRGYWGGPTTGPGAEGVVYDREATGAVLAEDGWLTTGDFGFTDPGGCLHLVGRANELYIRGGYNVYPAEVEAVLTGMAGVAEIAVFGLADDRWGQRVCAAVVAGRGADAADVLAACADHAVGHLAGYKRPKQYEVVDALPKTSTGKVRRLALAELLRLE